MSIYVEEILGVIHGLYNLGDLRLGTSTIGKHHWMMAQCTKTTTLSNKAFQESPLLAEVILIRGKEVEVVILTKARSYSVGRGMVVFELPR